MKNTIILPQEKTLLQLFRAVAGLPDDALFPSTGEKGHPPLKLIQTFSNEREISDFTQPFIYRHFPWLSDDPALFEAQLCGETEVYGYKNCPIDNSADPDPATFSGREIWDQFRQTALTINILDSECSNLETLLTNWHSGKLNRPTVVTWVLTVAPKLTYFHVDPLNGNCFMYLCRGKKIWLFIAPEDLAEVERRHGFEIINRLPLPELLLLDDGLLWGKIQIGMIGGGDFLYFPDGWAHFVRTPEHSFGYGGYFGQSQNEN